MVVTDLMDEKEKKEYEKFIEKHKNCECTSTIGGKITVEITGTGLGNILKCRCNSCGIIEDITNIDNW
jgi:hypothetical protein